MRLWSATAADLLCVLTFAVLGRSSHQESKDLMGVATTAWPFLVGTLIGEVIARRWGNPTAWRAGIVVLACTVVVGMGLRMASGRGFAPAFVVWPRLPLRRCCLAGAARSA